MRRKIAAIFALSIAGAVLMIFDQSDTHISKVVINRPYEAVWAQISDPLNYADLYPGWIKVIRKTGENSYFVEDQFGGSYQVTTVLNREFGVVDLHVGKEVSRLRLFELSASSTAAVHLAKRWESLGRIGWFFHKKTTDRDLTNAKAKIEKVR